MQTTEFLRFWTLGKIRGHYFVWQVVLLCTQTVSRDGRQRSDRWCSDLSSVGVLTVPFVVSPCLKKSLEMFPPSAGPHETRCLFHVDVLLVKLDVFYILCMTIITVLCSLCFNIAHKYNVTRLRSGSRGGHNPPPLILSPKYHVNNAFVTWAVAFSWWKRRFRRVFKKCCQRVQFVVVIAHKHGLLVKFYMGYM